MSYALLKRPNEKPQLRSAPARTVQAKLEVGAPNDKYEREADAKADEVVGMRDVRASTTASVESVQRKCASCEADEEEVRRTPSPAAQTPTVGHDVTAEIQSARGRGTPLDASTRAFMETRFQNDFSNVRLHTDTRATDLSRSLQARAFSVGNDVFFNEGQFQPRSREGKRLLAHELTHTIQQTGGAPGKIQREPEESTPTEPEADTSTASGGKPSSCPADGSVRFITSDLTAKYTGTPDVEITGSDVTMKAKRFSASAMVRTVAGTPEDLADWQVGIHQTIHESSNNYACYAPPDPNRDPRGKLESGMVFTDFSTDPGGPVLDGTRGQDTPPFYNASDPAPRQGGAIEVSMNDTPQTTAPLFWDRDAAHGACLTKFTRVFEATAFVIAESSQGEVCHLAHAHWGFFQSFSPGTIALDSAGDPDVGNYGMGHGDFPITTGTRTGGYASQLSPPFANTYGKNATSAPIAAPCPTTGAGCIPRPTT